LLSTGIFSVRTVQLLLPSFWHACRQKCDLAAFLHVSQRDDGKKDVFAASAKKLFSDRQLYPHCKKGHRTIALRTVSQSRRRGRAAAKILLPEGDGWRGYATLSVLI
jgi:hypothetical protein